MNQHLKYALLFIASGIVTYFSNDLQYLVGGKGIFSTIFVVLTILLGCMTVILFVKIFTPQRHILGVIADTLLGLGPF